MRRITKFILICIFLLNPLNVLAAESNSEYEEIAEEIASGMNICPEVVEAIIFYESSFKADVVSSAGCVGLMQINPTSHKKRMERLDVTDLTDPYENILTGCDYLLELFQKYEDLNIVLDVYHTGTHKSIEEYEAGYVSKYASKIMEKAESLEREHEK